MSFLPLVLFLSGCGKGSQPKALIDKGAYAVQFSGPDVYYVSADKGADIQDSDITVEAWIKTSGGGPVFVRSLLASRIKLEIDNVAKFSVSTDTVKGSTPVNDGQWHHIAGVLAGEAHSHPVSIGCDVAAMAGIHIDIYVDGIYEDCADAADFPADLDCDECSNYIGRSTSSIFNGIIDEVRLWSVARTEGRIQQCKDQELDSGGGDCSIDLSVLKGYWKFNEGTGSNVKDHTGYSPASKFFCVNNCGDLGEEIVKWEDGWVAGYPF